MSTAFTPPLDDLRFVLDELIDVAAVQALPGQADTGRELIDAVREEAG